VLLGLLTLVLSLVVFATIGIALMWGSPSAGQRFGPVEVLEVTTGCQPDGRVSGTITVKNRTQEPVSDQVPLALKEHIPPSLGGSPQFVPTGTGTTVSVTLDPGETKTLSYGPLSTASVDPDANALRVDVNSQDFNPERSESFPPCVAPPTPTPVPPTATPVPPTATPVPPTATPVPPTATPVPPTATPVPPTATPVPPTATPVPPTATPTSPPEPTATATATATLVSEVTPSVVTPLPPTATATATLVSEVTPSVVTPMPTETPAVEGPPISGSGFPLPGSSLLLGTTIIVLASLGTGLLGMGLWRRRLARERR
jgi:hypothetical protein